MLLKEIMTEDVVTIEPNKQITEAAKLMQTLNVGSLPVCENGKLIGIITDRDIAVRVVADGLDPETTDLLHCMSDKLIYCYEDQTIEDAATLMEFEQIRRLPILNREKQLVGMVSLGDLAVKTGKENLTYEALEGISKPAAPSM